MMEKKEIQLPLAAFKLDVNNSGQPEEGQEISDTGPSRLRWRSAATLCTISRILPLNESRWCEERQPSPLSAGRVSLQHFCLFQFVSLVCCCYGIISPASILLILLFLFVFLFFPPHCFRFAFTLFLAFSASQLPSPHPCHWVQCRAVLCPVAPPLLWQGDVRVASFDVTSGPTSQQLSAPRLALSGAFFHCLSLIPFPLYPPLIPFFFPPSFAFTVYSSDMVTFLNVSRFANSFLYHAFSLFCITPIHVIVSRSLFVHPLYSVLVRSCTPLMWLAIPLKNIPCTVSSCLMWAERLTKITVLYDTQAHPCSVPLIKISWAPYHSLFPTASPPYDRFSFTKFPLTHLYLSEKLPVALTKINIRRAIKKRIVSHLWLRE